jgi:hypothetical protein
MRPRPIATFERLYLLTLIIGVMHAGVRWSLSATAPAGTVVAIQLLTFCVTLLLVLLVARRRSRVACGILVATFLIGLPVAFTGIIDGTFGGDVWVIAAQLVLQVAALGLLLRAESREWLAQSKPDRA